MAINNKEYLWQKRDEGISIANAILDRSIDSIVGFRKLSKMKHDFPEVREFMVFVSYESETDLFPREHSRSHYEDGFLKELDTDADRFLKEEQGAIEDACRNLIEALKSMKIDSL